MDAQITLQAEPLKRDQKKSPFKGISSVPVVIFNGIFIFLIVFFVVIFFQYRSGILPQPEHFSELFFSNPTTLVHTVTPGSVINIAFKIHNVEGQAQNYTYLVTLINTGANAFQTSLFKGNLQIDNNATQEVTVNLRITDNFIRGRVQIQLLERGQSIDYQISANERTNQE